MQFQSAGDCSCRYLPLNIFWCRVLFRSGSCMTHAAWVRFRWRYVTYPINIDQGHLLLVEMFADLLAALHKPDENKNIAQEKIIEALKAISSVADNNVIQLRNSLPRASTWQLDLSSMAGFQFVIDQNKNHLFRNESKILKDCLKGWKGFEHNLALESRQQIKVLRNRYWNLLKFWLQSQ